MHTIGPARSTSSQARPWHRRRACSPATASWSRRCRARPTRPCWDMMRKSPESSRAGSSGAIRALAPGPGDEWPPRSTFDSLSLSSTSSPTMLPGCSSNDLVLSKHLRLMLICSRNESVVRSRLRWLAEDSKSGAIKVHPGRVPLASLYLAVTMPSECCYPPPGPMPILQV